MTEQLSRSFADIEVRSDGTGRTIAGIIVPFDRESRVSDGGPSYLESFQRGAFAKTFRERGDRVKFLYQHNSREPIGRAVALREDAAGAYGEFKVSNIPAGDHALELVRDGVLDSFSVGFTPVKHETRGGVKVRTEVALREVSLVTFPAYEDARVQSVREAFEAMSEDERAELLRMYAEAHGLDPESPASTPDGEPERSVDEPASATHDYLNQFRAARWAARQKGIIQ